LKFSVSHLFFISRISDFIASNSFVLQISLNSYMDILVDLLYLDSIIWIYLDSIISFM
jgi:hypothetical protein